MFACQAYVNGPLRAELTVILQDRLQAAGLDADAARVEADDDDPDGQTLLMWYPAATPRSDYVRAAIKIESGAKIRARPKPRCADQPLCRRRSAGARPDRAGRAHGRSRTHLLEQGGHPPPAAALG